MKGTIIYNLIKMKSHRIIKIEKFGRLRQALILETVLSSKQANKLSSRVDMHRQISLDLPKHLAWDRQF